LGGGPHPPPAYPLDHEAEDPAPRDDVALRPIESSDGLLFVVTADDGRLSWLRAGEALSAVWLDATIGGFSVVPLSQVVEVTDTRHALEDLLGTGMHPQILLRVGWQEIGRGDVDRTSRRPLADVLRGAHRSGTNASAPHRLSPGGWRRRRDRGWRTA